MAHGREKLFWRFLAGYRVLEGTVQWMARYVRIDLECREIVLMALK